jgi:ABC-type iron transport system FetAB ATPase subunit
MDATPPALRINGLKSALAGPFTLALERGGCIGITGASGAGKSLLLRMIADLDPNDGEVFLDGAARSTMAAPVWRGKVVYVPAESGWWADLVVTHFPKPRLEAARALAARLGLPADLIDGPVARLSTGERQRLALIRALAAAPRVLLLDEPTSALDPDGAGRIEQILTERMAQGCAVILVTHDPAQAIRLAGRRYVMAAGRLEAAP